jgi:protein TonB
MARLVFARKLRNCFLLGALALAVTAPNVGGYAASTPSTASPNPRPNAAPTVKVVPATRKLTTPVSRAPASKRPFQRPKVARGKKSGKPLKQAKKKPTRPLPPARKIVRRPPPPAPVPVRRPITTAVRPAGPPVSAPAEPPPAYAGSPSQMNPTTPSRILPFHPSNSKRNQNPDRRIKLDFTKKY